MTTEEADHSPLLLKTRKPCPARSTLRTSAPVTIGAADEDAYRSKKVISSGTDMNPSGSLPSYWNPGRRVIQFGVNRCRESQLWLRHRCASFPRSSTACSMPRSDRQRLIASHDCTQPMKFDLVLGT